MKSLVVFIFALFITGCSYQHAKPLSDRMEECKAGYHMALKSGIRDMTENVIFQIVLKRMNGYLGDTKELETELSHLILVCEDESTRKKAELALYFLTSIDSLDIATIRAEYYDQDKMYQMLEKHIHEHSPEYTQVK